MPSAYASASPLLILAIASSHVNNPYIAKCHVDALYNRCAVSFQVGSNLSASSTQTAPQLVTPLQLISTLRVLHSAVWKEQIPFHASSREIDVTAILADNHQFRHTISISSSHWCVRPKQLGNIRLVSKLSSIQAHLNFWSTRAVHTYVVAFVLLAFGDSMSGPHALPVPFLVATSLPSDGRYDQSVIKN